MKGGSLGRRFGPFGDIAKTAWANRDNLGYAWRILNRGVCDGCALGTSGLKDWTIDGVHLCWIRLNLLRLNTMPAFDVDRLRDVSDLEGRSEAELREMGRLPSPVLRRRGEAGFTPIGWEEAIERIAARLAVTDRRRMAFYVVSRGTVNETYYVAGKAARYLGTNHVDNSARVCHSPSTTALLSTVGFAATTCSYKDFMESDLIVFFGSDAANNQPVTMKYLHLAKKRGARVAMVNPYREPGMDRYWVPSNVDSMLFGTQITDEFFRVSVGGDIAFIHGVLKVLAETGGLDERFLADKTVGWAEVAAALAEESFDELERRSGASKADMERFAELYRSAGKAIFVWSMGLTMHRHGVDNVRSVANLALARGMIGRPGCGLMAIRGHSGVQGGAEMGCVPNVFPGGEKVSDESAGRLEAKWGFEVPGWTGAYAAEMVDSAARGELDVLYAIGSNLFAIMPDSHYVRGALERIPLRVHHDLVLNPQMLVEPAEEVVLLPATTRYEMVGGNTETTTERRVIFNPEIPGRRITEARDEWRVLRDIVLRVDPERAAAFGCEDTAAIRREIAEVIPLYDGIQHLERQGDQFQWGGERLGADGRFGFDDGRARFAVVSLPAGRAEDGRFQLSTRRGKQFNSMVFGERDKLAGADRDAVILHPTDLEKLGLEEGQAVELRNDTGRMPGRAQAGDIAPGVVMTYWPESNVLIPRGVLDEEVGMPAYRDARVEIVPGERDR